MKRSFKGGLSDYEKRQALLALRRPPIPPKPTLSERQRARRQKQEDDMIGRALAQLSPESRKLELERMR